MAMRTPNHWSHKRRALQLRPIERRALQLRPKQPRALQLRPNERRALQLRACKVALAQIGESKHRHTQITPTEAVADGDFVEFFEIDNALVIQHKPIRKDA